MEDSKEHGLDGIAWPGARASQFIKATTRRGMHGVTNFFSICRLNLRCGEQENINSCNGLGSHGTAGGTYPSSQLLTRPASHIARCPL